MSEHFARPLRDSQIPVTGLDLGWTPFDKLQGLRLIVQAVWRIHPDIIHATNYHANLLTRLGRLFFPAGAKLIGSVRGEYTPKQLFYERLSKRACSTIVTNSPHLTAQLTQVARVDRSKIEEIPNGVDLARFSRPSEAFRPPPSVANASRIIVSVGRVSEQKSPHLLAEALGILRARGQLASGTRVLTIGERQSDEHQRKLEQVIARYALQDIIQQIDPAENIEDFYHIADVTVLASLWEGLPNAALESLAAGRPVIISEAANAAGVVTQGMNGWVVKTGDVEALANTLLDVLEMGKPRLASMENECRKRASAYSMESMVTRYETLYGRF